MGRFLALVILSVLITPVTAGRAAADSVPLATSSDYRFGPGDVIEVTVSPQHTYDRTVTIQPDGKISYPIAGTLPAAGLTVDQLVQKLQSGLNRDLVDPQVTITLRETSKREVGHVSVLGSVHSEGGFEMRQGSTIFDALAAVGGASSSADLHKVRITGADGSSRTVDISEAEQKNSTDPSLALQPGDRIFVPEGVPATVNVLGSVNKPSPYELQKNAHLLDAIAQAGGPTDKADVSRVTLSHTGESQPRTLDLRPLLQQGITTNLDLNPALQPGDTIFIPEAQRVRVVGNVAKQEVYPLKPNERVLDLLIEAGGAGSGATKAVLVRHDANGKLLQQQLDLKKVMVGDESQNALLQPGDLLYVPDKRHTGPGFLNTGTLTSLLYIFTIF